MSFTGTWSTTTQSPMGSQQAKLTLAEDDGNLTGSIAGQQGTLDISDGSVDGGSASWKASIQQPMPMTLEFSATLDSDKISGTVKLGAFGEATFEGTRD